MRKYLSELALKRPPIKLDIRNKISVSNGSPISVTNIITQRTTQFNSIKKASLEIKDISYLTLLRALKNNTIVKKKYVVKYLSKNLLIISNPLAAHHYIQYSLILLKSSMPHERIRFTFKSSGNTVTDYNIRGFI